MKTDNLRLKEEEIQLTKQYNKLAESHNQSNKELHNLHKKYVTQEKLKEDNLNKIYLMQQKNTDYNIKNQKLQDLITQNQIEKENIFRALINFSKKYDKKLPNSLKEIYNKYNNEYFTSNYLVNNDNKIELLYNRIENLELEIEKKTNELDKIKKSSRKRTGSFHNT